MLRQIHSPESRNNCLAPAEFNDDVRVDLTGGRPAISCDPGGALEIDDAWDVTELQDGSRVVKRIVADTSRFHTVQAMRQLFDRGPSIYGTKPPQLMLDDDELRAMELRGSGPRRAIVTHMVFDRKGRQQNKETRVEPAWVEVENAYYRIYHDAKGRERIAYRGDVDRIRRDAHMLSDIALRSHFRDVGRSITEKIMVLGNLSTCAWLEDADVSMPYRAFEPFRIVNGAKYAQWAYYTHLPLPHHGFEGRRITQASSPLRKPINAVTIAQIGVLSSADQSASLLSPQDIAQFSREANERDQILRAA